MTRPIETPVQAKEALMHWFIETPNEDVDKLPKDVREKLESYISAGMGPVDASVNLAELIYARADELPVELIAIGASSAAMAASHGFHDMGKRGDAIAFHLRERPGVLKPKAPLSAEVKAPAPKELFVAPEADTLDESKAPAPKELSSDPGAA